MKKILQKAAHIIRGLFFYPFYYIPYRMRIPEKVKSEKQIIPLQIGEVPYKLSVNLTDEGLPEDLYINSIREYPNVYFFKDYVKGQAAHLSSYIDIGANIGYYVFLAHKALKQAGSHAKIYALEPVKSTYMDLRENVVLNRASDVMTLNVGIGDKDIVTKMVVMRQRNLSKIADGKIVPKGEIEKTEKIPLFTIRTLFAKNSIPKRDVVLRCDIEGYEYNLIVGNISFLRQLTNAHIIMEFHPFYMHAKRSEKLLRTLMSAGYTLDQVVSCEPLYFLRVPKIIHDLLVKLFLFQYDGDALGKIDRYRTIDDLIHDIKDEHNALYFYPNLHFYFSKK